MKYKIGDKVTIRKDLHEDRVYYMDNAIYCDDCTEEMIEMGGQIHVIKKVSDMGYQLDGIRLYNWTDEMFESED
jgi:hypothetical protein